MKNQWGIAQLAVVLCAGWMPWSAVQAATTDFELTTTGTVPTQWDANRKASFNFSVKLKRSDPTSAAARICIGSTGAYEWDAGSPNPADLGTFTKDQVKTATGTVKAKGTANFTANVDFRVSMTGCPVSATGADSNTVAASLSGSSTTTTTTTPQYDLKMTFTAPTTMDQPVSGSLDFKVKLENIGTVAIPSGYKLTLRRYDHTGTGMSDTVGDQKDLPTLSPGGSQEITFTESTRPALAGGASSRTNLYKVGISPYYTDKTAANHIAEKGVRFIAGGTTAARFGDYLYGKFTHAKCLDCHAFSDSSSAKRSGHNNAGRTNSGTNVSSSSSCSGCHTPATSCAGAPGCVASGWHAPGSGMNWSGKTAAQTCALIKTGSFATASSMKSHLKNDALIVWALGRMSVSTSEWNGKVDAWVDGGMKCE